MSQGERLRLFLDSNVLTGGIVSAWGLDKAVLSLCAARICRLVLAEVVREEVEENLLLRLGSHADDAKKVLNAYARLIALTKPEIVPYPDESAVKAGRYLIRHAADVPVLLSAIASRPDWLLTNNTKHFTPSVASRCGLKIATPAEFFRGISNSLRPPP